MEKAVFLYRKVAALLEPQETYAELVNSFQVWLATCNVEIYSLHLLQELRCTLLRYAASSDYTLVS